MKFTFIPLLFFSLSPMPGVLLREHGIHLGQRYLTIRFPRFVSFSLYRQPPS